MFPDQRRSPPPADVRPRRTLRQPAWMDDYAVSLPALQRSNYPPHDAAYLPGRQRYHSMEGASERFARMTPLTPPALNAEYGAAQASGIQHSAYLPEPAAPLYQSTPAVPQSQHITGAAPDVMAFLHRIVEDNQRMQQQMSDLHRRLDTSAALPHLPPQWPSAPPPSLQSSAPHPTLRPIKQANDWSQSFGSPPPPPAQPSAYVLPTGDDGDWPLPPPPIAEEAEQPASPAKDLVEELTALMREMHPIQPRPVLPQPPPPVPRVPTPEYCQPYTPAESEFGEPISAPQRESVYRGPKAKIPPFTKGDPREFARLKDALENLLPRDATERFKFQILVDHLKYEDALLIADSYTNSPQPYTDTMASLTEHYGQPHQLALRHIADLMDAQSVAHGDTKGFKRFALQVRSLVGLLNQLGESGQTELCCGSHVSRLLSKLPHDMRAEFKRFLYPQRITIPTLLHFSDWLNYELKMQQSMCEPRDHEEKGKAKSRTDRRQDSKGAKVTSILHTTDQPENAPVAATPTSNAKPAEKTAYCPFCNNNQHFLDHCANFKLLTVEQKTAWIKVNKRCWCCARLHQAAQCRLKMQCHKCKGKHLQALHDVNTKSAPHDGNAKPATENLTCFVSTPTVNDVLYLDRRSGCNQVLLKVSRVLLQNGPRPRDVCHPR